MSRAVVISGLVVVTSFLYADEKDVAGECERCGWKRPKAAAVVRVGTANLLHKAVKHARSGGTILVEDGGYELSRQLHITAKGVTLRGMNGERSRVVIVGGGMVDDDVGVGISVAASNVTIADLAVGNLRYHGIQVRGERGAKRTTIHNVRIFDCGQQLLKGSAGFDKQYADEGLVACSTFEYSTHAPSDYTNGVDVLAGKGWKVRDCVFRNIRGPQSRGGACGPAILFWANSIDTVVERNLLVDCYRGIALGLKPGLNKRSRDGEKRLDHQGGVVRQNVICNLQGWADEGIEINGCSDFVVEQNTVFVEGKLPWSIGVRFPRSNGIVRNNLTSRRVIFRDGGVARLSCNIGGATRAWFVDVKKANLHLAGPDVPAVDAAHEIEGLETDFDRKPRKKGRAPDVGAFELGSER